VCAPLVPKRGREAIKRANMSSPEVKVTQEESKEGDSPMPDGNIAIKSLQ